MSQKSPARWFLPAVALAATAILVLLSGTDAAPRADRAAASGAESPAPRTTAPSGPAGLAFVAGDWLTYRFVIDRKTRFHGGERPLEQRRRYAGAFTLTVAAQTATGWVVAFGMNTVEAEGEPAPRMAGEVRALIERSGEISCLAFAESAPARARLLWREILTHWRIVHGDDPSADMWETVERDVTGTYRARYERAGDRIERSKLEYTALDTGGLDARSETKGLVRYHLDPLPRTIEGRELLTVSLKAVGARVESDVAFRYERTARERRAARPLSISLAGGTALHEAEDPNANPDPVRVRAAVRRGLDRLAALLAVQKEPEARQVIARIVPLAKRSGAAVDEIRQRLEDATCTDRLTSMLTMALGAAGTPAAQEVLHGILTHGRWTDARRRMAVLALIHVDEPIAALDGALKRLHAAGGHPAASALAVLGSLGNKVHESAPGRYEEVRRYVESRLANAKAPHRRMEILAALGNVGPDSMSDSLRAALANGNLAVRATAFGALRRLRDAEADRILVGAVTGEETPMVRRAAIESLVQRHREDRGDLAALPLPLVDLLDRIAREDSAKEVRDLAGALAEQMRLTRAP